MKVLEGQEPASVLGFFEEICGIPHGSTNTKQISDYIVQFAKDRGLEYYQDDLNNVIIYKGASLPNGGLSTAEPVILQGHIDMVCEKEAGFEFDFEKDALNLRCDNGVISAEGTTLGADDGIAVAYMLAIMDSSDIVHPPLEMVFTVDEEIGMLKGKIEEFERIIKNNKIIIDAQDKESDYEYSQSHFND